MSQTQIEAKLNSLFAQYESARQDAQARLAASVAISWAHRPGSPLTNDQRHDIILASLSFCESVAITDYFEHIAAITNEIEVATKQDRVNVYATATMDAHQAAIENCQKRIDRFFNLWDLVFPEQQHSEAQADGPPQGSGQSSE